MKTVFTTLASCSIVLCAQAPAAAQSVRLPIEEGVWVKAGTPCGKAYIAHVHANGRFGTVYFFGPNQGMGPANETEKLTRASKSTGGFTTVNEGPLEVAARPNGQAIVRAFSPTQGEQWADTVRQCPPASLSAKMRTALARIGLLPAGKPKPK